MIILFLVLAFLRTLQGTPVPAHAPTPTTLDANVFLIRNASTGDTGGQNLRTTYGILQSCVLTIFACVWSSGHPNIAGPRDAGWTCLKRRLVTMLYALIAPEMVAFWALRQHIAADKIARDYNRKFAISRVEPKSQMAEEHQGSMGQPSGFWHRLQRWFVFLRDRLQELFRTLRDGIKEWFTILPKDVTRRGKGQAWTKTHGFFVQMEGLLLYDDEYPTRVLGYDALADLIRKKEIDPPTLTERDLQDRSKGDGISKGFVVLQTTWFVIQCITRLCQHLPLSELEVLTLGFAALNTVIYAIWWNKPQGVGVAICIPLKVKKNVRTKRSGQKESTDRTSVGSRIARESDREGGTSDSVEPKPWVHKDMDEEEPERASEERHSPLTIILAHNMEAARLIESRPSTLEDENSPAEKGWLRRQLEKDSSDHHWPVFALIRVPYRCGQSLLRPLYKMVSDDGIPSGALRVPTFFGDNRGDEGLMVFIASSVIGTMFGAVHLLAWSSDFPSRTERLLWRISALVITAEPVFMLIMGFLEEHGSRGGTGEMLYIAFGVCFILVLPVYIIARVALLTLAFISLRALPPQVLIEVSWTSFIPHL